MPRDDVLYVTRSVLEQWRAHARAEHPVEACGLLIGRARRVVATRPVENVHADPVRAFAIAPDAWRGAEREAGRRGLEVIGIHHAHPFGRARPSTADALAARRLGDDMIWVVSAAASRAERDCRAWIWCDSRFQALPLAVVEVI